MKRFAMVLMLGLGSLLLTGCGVIDQGDVGVRTSFGELEIEPVEAGFYTAVLSDVTVYTTKETSVALTKLQPKASDNLSLEDLEVEVYYTPNVSKVPWFQSKYSGMSARLDGDDSFRVGYNMVKTISTSSSLDAVSTMESLKIHTQRNELEAAIKQRAQQQLDVAAPGMFTVTRVLVTKAATDPSIEQSIRDNVTAAKRLDTTKKQTEIKNEEAKQTQTTAASLTPEFLQHEYNMAITACAANPKCTLIVDGSGGGKILNVGNK